MAALSGGRLFVSRVWISRTSANPSANSRNCDCDSSVRLAKSGRRRKEISSRFAFSTSPGRSKLLDCSSSDERSCHAARIGGSALMQFGEASVISQDGDVRHRSNEHVDNCEHRPVTPAWSPSVYYFMFRSRVSPPG